jgi:hypothetical protein
MTIASFLVLCAYLSVYIGAFGFASPASPGRGGGNGGMARPTSERRKARERDLYAAVGIGHYHLALVDPSSGNWAARAARRDRILGKPVPPLTDAIDLLRGHDPRDDGDARSFRKHANAVLAQGLNIAHRDPSRKGLSRSVKNHLRDHLVGTGISVSDIETPSVFGAALAKTYDPESDLTFRVAGPCDLDDAGVSRFYAEISRPKGPGERFERLAKAFDPQEWHAHDPQFLNAFAQRDAVEDPFFVNREGGPRRKVGKAGHYGFYELFRSSLFGLDLVQFNNLLVIDAYRDSGSNGTGQRFGFDYSLYESLSHSVLGGPLQAGGIDVDSNEPGSHTCSLELDAGALTVKAGKSIRYSNTLGIFQDELNLIALPAMRIWITELLFAFAAHLGDDSKGGN